MKLQVIFYSFIIYVEMWLWNRLKLKEGDFIPAYMKFAEEAMKFFFCCCCCSSMKLTVYKEDAFFAWLSLKSHNDSWETVYLDRRVELS